MVTTDDIGVAKLLFLIGNLCFLIKVIFSREMEVEHGVPSLFDSGEIYEAAYSGNNRVAYVTVAVLMATSLTSLEWLWAEGKRIRPLPSQPAALQAPLPPPFVMRVSPSTLNPSGSKDIPSPKVKVIPPANGKKGPDQTSSSAGNDKPKSQPELYPIISVPETKVTYDKDAGKVTVVVSIGNTTQTEANAHIEMRGVGFTNGSATTGDLNSTSRDIGLAPPPLREQMTGQYTVQPLAKQSFEDGTTYIVVYITVTYPDRGKTTTYHFEGKTIPSSAVLDELSSGWDGPK